MTRYDQLRVFVLKPAEYCSQDPHSQSDRTLFSPTALTCLASASLCATASYRALSRRVLIVEQRFIEAGLTTFTAGNQFVEVAAALLPSAMFCLPLRAAWTI
jgi:hypothetical protein